VEWEITYCEKHSDGRGYLVEFLKGSEIDSRFEKFGQIYFVTFEKRGVVRGNHYHTRFYEWFGIGQGVLDVVLEDVRTKRRVNFTLSGEDKRFARLHIGPYIAHAFKSLSETAVLFDYCNEQYDRCDPDRNSYILIPPN
jgi:dTDP-4-dehydrorhamnose 3,5-epimerase-like enzyme